MTKKELQILIGRRIREIREGKSISQIDLASACNFEKSNMSRIEHGNTSPNIMTLFIISQALEVPLKDLFDFPNA